MFVRRINVSHEGIGVDLFLDAHGLWPYELTAYHVPYKIKRIFVRLFYIFAFASFGKNDVLFLLGILPLNPVVFCDLLNGVC